jgi:hypothetical protein
MHQQSVMRGNIVPAPIPPDSPKEKDKEETSMNWLNSYVTFTGTKCKQPNFIKHDENKSN